MDKSADGLARFQRKWPAAPGRALVVGSKQYDEKADRRRLYEDAVGVDLEDGPGVDWVHDMEQHLPACLGVFDHVDCVSVLEHVRRPWKMAESIEACLSDGGSILISVPFVWRPHAYPSDFWRMTAEALPVLFPRVEWLARRYLINGKFRKVIPALGGAGGPYLARTELLAYGVKVRP